MSDDASGMTTAERGLAGASDQVASFEEGRPSIVRRVQHFFHQNPTMIPAIWKPPSDSSNRSRTFAFPCTMPGRF